MIYLKIIIGTIELDASTISANNCIYGKALHYILYLAIYYISGNR